MTTMQRPPRRPGARSAAAIAVAAAAFTTATAAAAPVAPALAAVRSPSRRPGRRDDHQLTCYVNWFWVTFTTHHNDEPGSGPTLYLKVDDIDDFYGAVLAHGFTPPTEPRKDRSGRREFFLLDPDGNRLAFFAR